MSRTGSGISIHRSVETSCMITAIGNSGAKSLGPIGCPVPGCSTAGGGTGRSAAMLYQAFGIRSSPSTYFFVFVMIFPPLFCPRIRDAVRPRVDRVMLHVNANSILDPRRTLIQIKNQCVYRKLKPRRPWQGVNGRGRDEDFSSPPAQIPACAANAPGSSLGSDVLR